MSLRPHYVTGFEDLLLDFIEGHEASIRRVYSDSIGIPTLGIGFALFDKLTDGSYQYRYGSLAELEKKLSTVGIVLTPDDRTLLSNVFSDLNQGLVDMAKSRVPVYVAGEDSQAKNVFSFYLGGTQGDTSIRGLYEISMGETKDYLRSRLGTFSDGSNVYDSLYGTQEMVALLSLAFNAKTLIGNNLVRTIQNEDRSEAWYQIRYQSNKNGIHASRRYSESDTFCLYNDTVMTDSDAKGAYRTFSRHKSTITDYENKYDPTDIHAGSTRIEAQLSPAHGYLVNNFLTTKGIGYAITWDHIYVGEDASTTYFRGSDDDSGLKAITGSDQSDLFFGESGNDVLLGGAGGDIYYGGKGNDTFSDGAGFDFYMQYTGDGRDEIYDLDGQGQIRFDDVILTGGQRVNKSNDGVNNTYKSADGAFNYVRRGSDLLIVKDQNQNAGLTISDITVVRNYQPGALGMRVFKTLCHSKSAL